MNYTFTPDPNNPHIIVQRHEDDDGQRYGSLVCSVESCHWGRYGSYADNLTREELNKLGRDHWMQYEPGHAPDIEVDWTPSTSCPICEEEGAFSYVDLEVVDDGYLQCPQCKTVWGPTGEGGERAEED